MSTPAPIKAIPTHYKNILFRSKLEASYAMALDELGIEWAYEVEGYVMKRIKYLPDFWLPNEKVILEVKGVIDNALKTLIFADYLKRSWSYGDGQTEVIIGDAQGYLCDASFSDNNEATEGGVFHCSTCGQNWIHLHREPPIPCTAKGCGDLSWPSSSDKIALPQIRI